MTSIKFERSNIKRQALLLLLTGMGASCGCGMLITAEARIVNKSKAEFMVLVSRPNRKGRSGRSGEPGLDVLEFQA